MKILKIVINIIGFLGMLVHIKLSSTLFKVGNCHTIFQTVKNIAISLIPECILFLILITLFNLLFEHTIQKHGKSKEFILLFAVQLSFLSFSILYYANKTYLKFSCA